MDVVCLGELMIDMIGEEIGDPVDVQTFRKYPGGAAGNVAVGVAKLGQTSGFLGRVSRDPFGDYLVRTVESYGVDSRGIVRDPSRNSTVAFISLDEKKIPSYLFYREASASTAYSPQDIRPEAFESARFLYFSSLSLAKSPIREANYEAVRLAKENHCLIAFDPNVRLHVWSSAEAARDEVHRMLENVDLLKVNDSELHFLFGEGAVDALCRQIFAGFPRLKLIAVTLGEQGSFLMDASRASAQVDALPLPVVDTGGAGDSYTSAMLVFWIRGGEVSGVDALRKLGVYANSAAHITARRKGVIPALPTQAEVDAFLREYRSA